MKLHEVVRNSCRVCLKRTPKLRSLYNPLDEGEEPPNEMLRLIAGIKLEEVDAHETLPKYICKHCELSLSLAFQFRVKVLRTHQIIECYRKRLCSDNDAGTNTDNSTAINVKEELDDSTMDNQCHEEVFINEDQLQNNREMKVEVLELSFSDIEEIDMADEEEVMFELNQEEEVNEGCKPEYLDEVEIYSDEEALNIHTPESETSAAEHKTELFNYDDANGVSDDESVLEVNVKEEITMPAKRKLDDENWRVTKESAPCKTLHDNVKPAGKPAKCRSPNKMPSKEKLKQQVIKTEPLERADDSRKQLSNGNAAHICDICGNIYAKRGRMMEHRRRHDKELRFACELCDKRFHLREKLRKHMFLHTGGKPYKCSFCSRTFFYESVKKAHEAVHSGVKPYVCDVCNKAFAYAHALSKHKLIHADIKLYHCEYCGKDFRLQHHMKQHIETKLHQNAVRVAQMSLVGGHPMEEQPISTLNT